MSQHNSMPHVGNDGWEDKSTRALPPAVKALPQHLPWVPFLAPRGDGNLTLGIGKDFLAKYGVETLDPTKPYYTHQNHFLELFNSKGNVVLGKRMIMPNAAKARRGIAFELVVKDIVQYERSLDGKFKLDSNNERIPTGDTKPGILGRWVMYKLPAGATLGTQPEKGGTLIGNDGVASRILPFWEGEVADEGEYGDNVGIRFYGPTNSDPAGCNETFIRDYGNYLYRFSFVERPDAGSTAKPIFTTYGETSVDFCLETGVIDKSMDMLMDYNERIRDGYLRDDTTVELKMPVHEMHFYDDNIKIITDLIFANENPAQQNLMTSPYEINLANAVDPDDVPYYTFELAGPDNGGLFLSRNTNLLCTGGSDGDLTEENFEKAVREYANDILTNPAHELLDSLRYPFSTVYDSGYTLETKYSLVNIMGIRTSSNVTSSTQDVNKPQNTTSQDMAFAQALMSRFKMYPESVKYGTPVARGNILSQAGYMIKGKYRRLVPATYELAAKRAEYMGAANGIMKSEKAYDQAENNGIKYLKGINNQFVPFDGRRQLWDNGVTYIQTADEDGLFFPAIQTVTEDPTSNLNSDINMCINCYVTRLRHRVWRNFSGNARYNNEQLAERVDKFYNKLLKPEFFDFRAVLEATTDYTKLDLQKGYSYSTKVTSKTPNMKSVMNFTLQSQRVEGNG